MAPPLRSDGSVPTDACVQWLWLKRAPFLGRGVGGGPWVLKQISLGFSRLGEALDSFPVAGRAERLSTFFFKVLSCLAILLRKQDLEAWGYPITLQVYHGLLSFTVHAKPKVRLWLP